MNILDYIAIAIILIAGLTGFKKGFIGALVAFVGTILVMILAFYLKNPVSAFLYDKLPFFGSGVSSINILIYEGLSFLLTLIILSSILGIILKITGIVNKIVDATVLLTLPSKLLGMVCGLIEGYLLAFIILFIIGLVAPTSKINDESKYASVIVTKTPIVSSYAKNTYDCISEVYGIITKYSKNNTDDTAEKESLKALLNYEILSVESADKLIDKGKLKGEGLKEIVDSYRK